MRMKTPPHPDPLPRWGEGKYGEKGRMRVILNDSLFTVHRLLFTIHRISRIDSHAGLRHHMTMKTQGSACHGVSLH